MEAVEKARKKRKPIRGAVTKLLNKVDDLLKEDSAPIEKRKLKQYEANIAENVEVLKRLDEEILDGLVENDADDDVCEKEVSDASEIKERVTYSLIYLKEALEKENVNLQDGGLSRASRTTSKESIVSEAESIASRDSSMFSVSQKKRVKASYLNWS